MLMCQNNDVHLQHQTTINLLAGLGSSLFRKADSMLLSWEELALTLSSLCPPS